MKAMLKNTTNIIIALASLFFLAATLKPIILSEDPSGYAAKLDEQVASLKEAQLTKKFFEAIRARNFEAVKSSLDPKIVDAQFNEKIAAFANLFPNEAPRSVKFVGSREIRADGVLSNIIIYMEYEFSNKWILATARLQKFGNDFVVIGIETHPTTDSIANRNKFRFLGQDVKHRTVFASAILLLILNIYAFALCIKEVASRPKAVGPWLWTIFVLIGFGKVEFNWINGMFYFFGSSFPGNSNLGQAIEFVEFPAVKFSLSPYQPLVIMMSVPLGAILFLLRRKITGRGRSV